MRPFLQGAKLIVITTGNAMDEARTRGSEVGPATCSLQPVDKTEKKSQLSKARKHATF